MTKSLRSAQAPSCKTLIGTARKSGFSTLKAIKLFIRSGHLLILDWGGRTSLLEAMFARPWFASRASDAQASAQQCTHASFIGTRRPSPSPPNRSHELGLLTSHDVGSMTLLHEAILSLTRDVSLILRVGTPFVFCASLARNEAIGIMLKEYG